ncbi:sensor domain-containing protein [Mycolicibacterium sp. HK-90]|uniref:sensor domain-containing protein n=1 Tax=Mycolicibacterium sp. HK-90 TaxID=3056937 RepID=UPI002658013D|nr:sensor domain-containing protein [Mycolicibacterium sp. HK-90]WKG03615.1 sensor domain-containing protein [Mycolicibacterium sp. HK-90]
MIAVIVLAGAGLFFLGGDIINSGSDDKKSDTANSAATDTGDEPKGATDGSPKTPTSSAPTTSEAPTVSASEAVDPASLPGLLASVSDLNERFTGNFTPAAATQTSPFSGMTVEPSNCAGALLPGIDYVYRTANYSGFAGQILSDKAIDTTVMQAVIAFNSETEATRFFNDQYTAWKGCNYTEINTSGGGQEQTIKTGVAAESDGTAQLLMWKDHAGSDKGCQRGMSPRKNVIVDVRVCSLNVASSGYTLVRDIGAKITGKR